MTEWRTIGISENGLIPVVVIEKDGEQVTLTGFDAYKAVARLEATPEEDQEAVAEAIFEESKNNINAQ